MIFLSEVVTLLHVYRLSTERSIPLSCWLLTLPSTWSCRLLLCMPWNWTVFDNWQSLCFDWLFTSGRNLSLLSVTWYVVLLLASGWDNCSWWARPFLSVGYAFLPYIHSRRMRHLRWGFEGLCHFCIKLGRMLDAWRLDGRVYIHRIFWHWNFIPCLVCWICILHRYGLILIQAEYTWSFGSRESSFDFPFLWSL